MPPVGSPFFPPQAVPKDGKVLGDDTNMDVDNVTKDIIMPSTKDPTRGLAKVAKEKEAEEKYHSIPPALSW